LKPDVIEAQDSVVFESRPVPFKDPIQFSLFVHSRTAFFDKGGPYDRRSAKAMNTYFSEIIAERRVQPKDDLLSQLIAVEEDDCLTGAGVIASCSLLLSAGHETTTNLIGNGLLFNAPP
jgi:pimeloyl-[acyl-carrier protein] synthase